MKEKPTINKGSVSVAAKIEKLKEVAASDNQEQYLNNDVISAEVKVDENEVEHIKNGYIPIIPPCESDSALQGISITVLPESDEDECEKSVQVVELSVVKRALSEVLNERQRIRQQGSKRKKTTPPVVSAVIDILLVIVVMSIVFLVGTYLYGNIPYTTWKSNDNLAGITDARAEMQVFDIFAFRYFDSENYLKSPVLGSVRLSKENTITITNHTTNRNPIKVEITDNATNTLLFSTDLIPVRYTLDAEVLLPLEPGRYGCTVAIWEVAGDSTYKYAETPMSLIVPEGRGDIYAE